MYSLHVTHMISVKPKILAFAGTTREDSTNKKLIAIAAQGATKAGAEVTLIDIRDYPVPPYNGDMEIEEGLPENARKLKQLMVASDGFLVSTPEYNGSTSGVLKNLLDWASRKEAGDQAGVTIFNNKAVVIMSASTSWRGGILGQRHLRDIFMHEGAIVLPKSQHISNSREAFNENDKLKDSDRQAMIEELGKDLVDFLRK